jgi:surface polysaccharide O-acyltransferase-like enzyme
MGNTRYYGIDILKTIALLSIIGQHFFTLQTPFKQSSFVGVSMFIQGVAMNFFLIGVPLFVAITGYLNAEKKISCRYYRNLLKVIIPYILISIIYIVVRIHLFDETITIRHSVGMILRFNAIPYGWFIEMWIGLYLLIPFLNILFNCLPSKRTALLLIITLAILTIIPMTTNQHGFHFLPNYWNSLWPLLCYYIGTYIRKYQPYLKTIHLIVFIVICCCIEPLLNLILFPGRSYILIIGTCLLTYPAMAAFFILLYQCNIQHRFVKNILNKISDLSLYIYLFFALFDMLMYPVFLKNYINQQQFGLYFIIIVPLLFILSFITSYIFDLIIKIVRIDRIWKPVNNQK